MEPSLSVPDVAGRDLAPARKTDPVVTPPIEWIQTATTIVTNVMGEVYLLRDLRAVLPILEALEQFGRDLRILIAEAHNCAAELMGKEKKIDLGVGIGQVERFTSADTKWSNDDLILQLVKQCPPAVDPITGAVTFDGVRFVELMKECLAISYWRKAPLRKMGLDPDEFSKTSYGGKRVRVRSQEGRNAVHRGAESGSTQA